MAAQPTHSEIAEMVRAIDTRLDGMAKVQAENAVKLDGVVAKQDAMAEMFNLYNGLKTTGNALTGISKFLAAVAVPMGLVMAAVLYIKGGLASLIGGK